MPPVPRHRMRLLAVADVRDWELMRHELPRLDNAAQRRVERLRFPHDRKQRDLAYALHQMLADWWLQQPCGSTAVVRLASGAPRIQDRSGAAIAESSLSHSAHHVAIAIAPVGDRIGVDVEDRHTTAAASLPDMRALLLSAVESMLGDDQLLPTWVRKEAVLKATGQGLSVDMASFSAEQARRVQGLPGCNLRSWAFQASDESSTLLGWAANDAEGSLLELHPQRSRLSELAEHLQAE